MCNIFKVVGLLVMKSDTIDPGVGTSLAPAPLAITPSKLSAKSLSL